MYTYELYELIMLIIHNLRVWHIGCALGFQPNLGGFDSLHPL